MMGSSRKRAARRRAMGGTAQWDAIEPLFVQ
jgi:hypothetical protein